MLTLILGRTLCFDSINIVVPGTEFVKEPNQLIPCFDGIGNKFSGSSADTNVIKILNKLDRRQIGLCSQYPGLRDLRSYLRASSTYTS